MGDAVQAAATLYSAFALVYTAYTQVKSNRARCAQLKDRCEMIMVRAREMCEGSEDWVVRGRLEELERTFGKTAETIRSVGGQSWVTSLLRTTENAALIADTQHALTELIGVLNLQMVVDIRQWQKESEEANRRDIHRLVSMVKRLQLSTDTAHAELRNYGVTLDRLEQIASLIEQRDGYASPPMSPRSSPASSNKDLPNLPPSRARGRSWSSPTRERPAISGLLRRNGRPDRRHDILNNAVATAEQNDRPPSASTGSQSQSQSHRPTRPLPARARIVNRIGRSLLPGVATGTGSGGPGPAVVTSPLASAPAPSSVPTPSASISISASTSASPYSSIADASTDTRPSGGQTQIQTQRAHPHSPLVQSPLSQSHVAASAFESHPAQRSAEADEKERLIAEAESEFVAANLAPPPSSAASQAPPLSAASRGPPPSSAAFSDAPPPTGASIVSALSDYDYDYGSVFDDEEEEDEPDDPPPPYSAMNYNDYISDWQSRHQRPEMPRVQTRMLPAHARGGYNLNFEPVPIPTASGSQRDQARGREYGGVGDRLGRATGAVVEEDEDVMGRPSLNRTSDSLASITPIPPTSPAHSAAPSVISYTGPEKPTLNLAHLDPVDRVRTLLKLKEANNFGALKTIGNFGSFSTRVLVEMWMLPQNARVRTYKRAIPLDAFQPSTREKLQVITPRGVDPLLLSNTVPINSVLQPQYNNVILLCPADARPTVIITKTGQMVPQTAVKAYIFEDLDPVILVSVNELDRISWFLIPYGARMTIQEAKRCVQGYFGDAFIERCTLPGQSKNLDEQSTFRENGIKAYNHHLSMRVRLFAT